ncbi:MAG: SDH family Clp fold serine proteinase [Promethearchaeota archaeon]
MPSRKEISDRIQQLGSSNDINRREFLKELAKHSERDTIIYSSGYTSFNAAYIPEVAFIINKQDIQGFMSAFNGLKGKELDLIIHSPGGNGDAAAQIVNYMRQKYEHVRAIIPQNAMSAATMLACACDEIIMGKHSALGPIDPQISFQLGNGMRISSPAQSIIEEFEMAKRDIDKNPNYAHIWAPRMLNLPIGILQTCQDASDHAQSLVKDWLASYMFKDESDGIQKAELIAEWLSEKNQHKSHGKPIDILEAEKHGIKVEALEDDHDFQDLVLSVFHSSCLTHEMTTCVKIIENHLGKGLYTQVRIQPTQLPQGIPFPPSKLPPKQRLPIPEKKPPKPKK